MPPSNTPSPFDDGGRPLDARELEEFERIIRSYRRVTYHGLREDRALPRDRRGRASPPTWREALLVLGAGASFAVTSALLPHPVNLWAPLVLLMAIAAACVVWGLRGRRSQGDSKGS